MRGSYVAPSIKVIDDAFTQTEEFLKTALAAPEEMWLESTIDAYNLVPEFRHSRELPIPYGLMFPKVFSDMAWIVHNEASTYAKENGFEFPHMENFTLVEYKPEVDFIDRHDDWGPSQPRSMSAVLYMNTIEEGGELIFDKFDLTLKPVAGRLVLFPANFAYTHQVLPPISGVRYAIITFFGQQLSDDIFTRYYPKYSHWKDGSAP